VLHDVLALAPVWANHQRLLVSDASLPSKHPSPIAASWISVLLHSQRSQFHHARLVRLERLREQFAAGLRSGGYWGLSGEWLGMQNAGGGHLAGLDELGRIQAYFLRLPPRLQEQLELRGREVALRALGCQPEDAMA